MNTPIQMRQIIQFSSKGKLQLDRSFLFVWILCGMETCARLICTVCFSSQEIFYKIFSPFNIESYICFVLLLEYIVFYLWYIYLDKLYIWHNLLNSKHNQVQKETPESKHISGSVTVNGNEDTNNKMEMYFEETLYIKEDTDKNVKQIKRSKSLSDINDINSIENIRQSRRNSYPTLKSTLYRADLDFKSIKLMLLYSH